MVVEFSHRFEKEFKKIKDGAIKTKLKKQIKKIIQNPDIGKPMRFARKGTREVYVPPFRLAYAIEKGKIILLELYHKDLQ